MKYEYECDEGHRFEVEHGMLESPEVECPRSTGSCHGLRDECGAPARRVITGGSGFVLKGPRWARGGYSK